MTTERSPHISRDELRKLLRDRFMAPPMTPWRVVEEQEGAIYAQVDSLFEQLEAAEKALREIYDARLEVVRDPIGQYAALCKKAGAAIGVSTPAKERS